jgi:hypothetical protein
MLISFLRFLQYSRWVIPFVTTEHMQFKGKGSKKGKGNGLREGSPPCGLVPSRACGPAPFRMFVFTFCIARRCSFTLALAALRNLDGTKHGEGSTYAALKRRHISSAVRRRISLAQKRRWRNQRRGLHVLSTPTRKPQARVHWTQLPKNRARVLQLARKMTRARTAA